ncbi:MAG: hypothetical protein AB1817_11955 [Chloroflexota bacterium]
MNHREHILAAIRHQPLDRIPTDVWATVEAQEKLFDHFRIETKRGVPSVGIELMGGVCFEATRGLIDMTQVTDDFGSQNGLLISPSVFDKFYRAAIQRAIDLAKSYGLFVFHHDDGDLRGLLSRLCEMGIDILNPIQWRCGDWDLRALKVDFHKWISNYILPKTIGRASDAIGRRGGQANCRGRS